MARVLRHVAVLILVLSVRRAAILVGRCQEASPHLLLGTVPVPVPLGLGWGQVDRLLAQVGAHRQIMRLALRMYTRRILPAKEESPHIDALDKSVHFCSIWCAFLEYRVVHYCRGLFVVGP